MKILRIMFRRVIRRLICRHTWRFARKVYGDEINLCGGKRNVYVCPHCGAVRYKV